MSALVFFAAGGAPGDKGPSHAAEISFFAKTMAVAKTVKESCPGFTVDDRFLEVIRQRMHVEETDYFTFVPQARAATGELRGARDEAPNRLAWCDSIFRLHGPDGRLMQGLVNRQGK